MRLQGVYFLLCYTNAACQQRRQARTQLRVASRFANCNTGGVGTGGRRDEYRQFGTQQECKKRAEGVAAAPV